MKKIIISVFFLIFFIFSLLILYLSIFGYQTDRFNKILESKISNYNRNIKVGLKDIKIKIDVKNFNFFISTKNSEVFFSETKFRIKKVNAYLSLNSLLKRNIIIISGDGGALKKLPRIFCRTLGNIKYIINGLGGIEGDSVLVIHDNKIYSYVLK